MTSNTPINKLLKKANALYESGSHDQAQLLYQEILQIDPDQPDALHILGCIKHLNGLQEESIELIERAIHINPRSPVYYNNLGNILFAQKSYDAAADAFIKTLELAPDYAEGHYNLGLTAMERGDNAQAVSGFNKAIDLKPDLVDAYTNLGNVLIKMGSAKDAVNCLTPALKMAPDNVALNVNLCLALQSLGDRDKAEEVLVKSLDYIPDNPEILFNLGNIYQHNNRSEDAVACFEKALESFPDDTRIVYNLATTLMESDQKIKALGFYEKLLKLSGGDDKILNNMGLIHYDLGHYDKALDYFKQAIVKKPDFAMAFNNMGLAHKAMENFDQAIENFKKAIDIEPGFARVYHNLAEILRETGHDEEAAENCKKAIELEPDLAQANTHYSYLLKWQCQWEAFDSLTKHIDPMIQNLLKKNEPPGESPFMNIIRVDDPAYNKKVADAYAGKTTRLVKLLDIHFSHDRQKDDPMITIGYLSANFKNHPMAHLLANLFKYHNRNDFQINAYSLGPDDKCIYRQRFIDDADIFRDIRHLSHGDAASQIYNDRVDILVDLMGYTQGNRLEISALRPAPVQVRYMGLAGTTGGNLFDYIIVDEIVTPKDQQKNYSEKFIYMPHTYQINDQDKIISDAPVTRKMFDIPEDSFVFCSFNQSYKIDPQIFSTWLDILKETSPSVLWLMPGNKTAGKNLLDFAAKHGVDKNRLIFAEKIHLKDHLARLRLADLALDTQAIGGAATTSDALWAGIPVITLLGNRFASRMSASILTAIGLEELVTINLDDYKSLAVKLAYNKDHLSVIHQKLKENTSKTPLFDTWGFTMNLEKAYKSIWHSFSSGEKPCLLDLKKDITRLSTAGALNAHEYGFPVSTIAMY